MKKAFQLKLANNSKSVSEQMLFMQEAEKTEKAKKLAKAVEELNSALQNKAI